MHVNGIVFLKSHHFHIHVDFQASRFVNKLLSRITLENAMLLVPMLRVVVIELVITELWPFEAAITG